VRAPPPLQCSKCAVTAAVLGDAATARRSKRAVGAADPPGAGAACCPLDLSFKNSVKVPAAAPFDWCAAPRSADLAASMAFPTGEDPPPGLLTPAAALLHALGSYAFPAQRWPRVLARAALQPSLPDAPDALECVREAQTHYAAALHSLYALLRAGRCPYFYVLYDAFCFLFT